MEETTSQPNHIDNHLELTNFITTQIDNCIGIAVKMETTDTEQEVSKMVGILSYYHIIFRKQQHKFLVKNKECFCLECNANNFERCTNVYSGKIKSINLEVLGDKQPSGYETVRNGTDEATIDEEFVVEKIVGKRQHRVITVASFECKFNILRA